MYRAIAALLVAGALTCLTLVIACGQSRESRAKMMSAAQYDELRRDMLRLHAQISEHDVEDFMSRCRGKGNPQRQGRTADDECWISYGLTMTHRLQRVRVHLRAAERARPNEMCTQALHRYDDALRGVELVQAMETFREAAPALDEVRDTLAGYLIANQPAAGLRSCAPHAES